MTITEPEAIYRDPTMAVDDRIADLLARMTLDEKLAQLGSAWIFQLAGHDGFDVERATPLIGHGVGHITRMSGASSLGSTHAALLANEIQRFLLETRLGIPAIVHEEICSGLMAREATVYPQAIGVAATFRPEHNHTLADTIRRQMRSIGAHQGLSPVLDVCRDPRWGRLEETYGEDPYLVSQMGLAFIRGLQGSATGDDLTDGVVATAKHFVGYGASEGGMNWAPAHLPERELRDVYMRPFEAAVREAGLASVMNAYQEIDGVVCTGNRWLLTDVLRGEWGFDGTVVSDYFAVNQLHQYHRVVSSRDEAAAVALRAGIDVELPGSDCYGEPLRQALESGAISMADIDLAVGRALASKFRLGLFEQPYVDADAVHVHTRSVDQVALARALARDSLVLLRNDGVLPLSRPGSVAVIGPNAASARSVLGDYSYLAHVESLMEVLKSGRNVFAMPLDHGADVDENSDMSHVGIVLDELASAMPDADIRYAMGCAVNDDDRSGFDEAVAVAAASDVAIMVMGDRSGLTDECTTGESRDVASLDLPGVQEELVLAVAATGTPVVLVLIAGRPIGSERVHDVASAVLMAWLPGEQGAAAIADALTGAVSPGGKLPVSYPRSSGQVPVFFGHKVSGGRSHWKGPYVDISNEPLHPFGFGLSYSRFALEVDHLDGVEVGSADEVTVSATVTNVGDVRADEVVQIYSRDPVASVTRPVLELQGFARLTLDPGATGRVTCRVPVAALAFTGADLTCIVEPGRVEFFVGTSSTDLHAAGHVTVIGEGPVAAVRPGSSSTVVEPAG